MLTLTCKLTYPDGEFIQGVIRAESADAEYPVAYTGNLNKLPNRRQQTDAGFLEFFFKTAAAVEGAKLDIQREGAFDRFAE